MLSHLFSFLIQTKVYGEPDWAGQAPTLFLLRNVTYGEYCGLRKIISGEAESCCHASASSNFPASFPGAADIKAISANATLQAREWISDRLARGHHALFLTRGFSPDFVDEVLSRARVPVRIVECGRNGPIDVCADHPILSLRPFRTSVRFYFSETISPGDYSYERIQREQLRLGQRALDDHPGLDTTVARACIGGLKRRQFSLLMTDAGQQGREMKAGMLLAVAWELSCTVKKLSDPRIGIVLPPGLAATIANLAVILAGKIPVNLNFTVGRAAVESALRTGGISRVISARQLVDKLPDFPWPDKTIDIARELKSLDKIAVLQKRWAVFWQSADSLADTMGLEEKGGHREAGLLFTSGSSGEPKGVPLSHRNILANVAQIDCIFPRNEIPSLLGCLPVFHSFGFTVGLWWPLISGPRVVTYPSPLEFTKLLEVMETWHPSLYVTTPTFLRTLMKRAQKKQLSALKMVVTGAEKLPPPLKEEFEEKFGIPVCEGYGMTEASPVVSVNRLENKERFIPGRVTGSVGPLLPGIDVRVTRVGSGEELPLGESGLIWYSGANVFRGYLNLEEKNAEVLRSGWYMSGDVGRLDREGFLYIEGRVSRFSKIAGEMVPHGTVESHLMDLLREQLGKEIHVAVFGKTDESKGESLVALIDGEFEREALRTAFNQKGFSNLWWPRKFIQVEEIPALASGKLDLQKCREVVDQGERASRPQ